MGKLTLVHAKLFLREPAAVFFVLALPVILLVVFGLIPANLKPDPSLGGQRVIDTLIPGIGIAVALNVLALNMMPVVFAGWREQGMLRRVSVTPVSPARILAAQLLIQFLMAMLSVAVLILVGRLAFNVALPKQVPAFVASVVLAALAMFGLGLFVAAVAPTTRASTLIGWVLFFPSMVVASVRTPRAVAPRAAADR
jgi:ABC-2 type transport system permease protein